MKIEICKRIFYLMEIKDENMLNASFSSSIVSNILPEGEYAVIRVEGRQHDSKKYVSKYFIITEIPDVKGIIFTQIFFKPVYISFSNKNSSSSKIGMFSSDNGIDRVLLVRISIELKKWYLERKIEFKTELRKKLTYIKEESL